jgi:hypothetical protein
VCTKNPRRKAGIFLLDYYRKSDTLVNKELRSFLMGAFRADYFDGPKLATGLFPIDDEDDDD